MNRETAKTSRFVHVLLRCAGVAAAVVLGGCGGDDATNPPAPTANGSKRGDRLERPVHRLRFLPLDAQVQEDRCQRLRTVRDEEL